MAIKLSKAQTKERDQLLTRLREAKEKLEAAQADYEAAMTAYDLVVGDIATWRDDVVSDWQSEFDDKSERWQEGERGEAASAFIQEWEGLELEELEEPNWPDLDHADDLEDLPTEPDLA